MLAVEILALPVGAGWILVDLPVARQVQIVDARAWKLSRRRVSARAGEEIIVGRSGVLDVPVLVRSPRPVACPERHPGKRAEAWAVIDVSLRGQI